MGSLKKPDADNKKTQQQEFRIFHLFIQSFIFFLFICKFYCVTFFFDSSMLAYNFKIFKFEFLYIDISI